MAFKKDNARSNFLCIANYNEGKSFPCRVARFFSEQHTKTGKYKPNDHKMQQMAMRYTKWLSNITNGHKINQHCPFQGSNINPNWYFWFENIPSGNPECSA
jgi:hypothetical protein